jgi:hypothetical protein
MEKSEKIKVEFDCDFCGHPCAKHEGGAEINGTAMAGHFCDKDCFTKWLTWKATLAEIK